MFPLTYRICRAVAFSLISSLLFHLSIFISLSRTRATKSSGKLGKIKKALKSCKKFDSVILDKTNKSVVIQITALRREIDKVIKNLKPLGLVSASRTGAVAMTRGAETFNN